MPAGAQAHQVIPGVTGFPGQMLHPLVIPEQAFLLAAAVLVTGRMEKRAFASALLALLAGLMAGKGAHLEIPWLSAYWYAPLVAACVAGLLVVAIGRIDARAGVAVVFILGFVLSVGIVPDQPTGRSLMMAVGATMATGAIVLAVLGLPLSLVTVRWGGVLIRVAGAWLAAIAMLNLALALAPMRAGG